MYDKTDPANYEDAAWCPIESTFDHLAGKWKALVLLRLLVRPRRFNELLRTLDGCSQRTLTRQLRELERDGLVSRTVFPEVPPRVEYELTERGSTLRPVFVALCEWGQVQLRGEPADFDAALATAK